ncbi:MAG TPA: SMI1/KNR4 family protein [Acidimicrobiales bacterium]|nr:SMI1/KNR4 family protein [Acidimicrobiales bacterium]
MTAPEPVAQAIEIIRDAELAVAQGPPADEERLAAAEQETGARFPPSYRAFLAAVGPIYVSYGEAGKASLQIYGLTGQKIGRPNVVWLYGLARTPDARRHLPIGDKQGGSWPFTGHYFALDLSRADASTGEAPVVSREGVPSYGDPVARDFGTWLLSTLVEIVPLSTEMWAQRIKYPAHSTVTKEYGQPGPRVYFSKCACGWQSHLKPETESLMEAARHVAHPEEMRAEPYWL